MGTGGRRGTYILKNRAGKMAQWSRTLTTPLEDLSSISSIHTVGHNCLLATVPGNLSPSFDLQGTAYTWSETYMQAETHKINKYPNT